MVIRQTLNFPFEFPHGGSPVQILDTNRVVVAGGSRKGGGGLEYWYFWLERMGGGALRGGICV